MKKKAFVAAAELFPFSAFNGANGLVKEGEDKGAFVCSKRAFHVFSFQRCEWCS
jgi:hypothetical protein